MNTETEGVFAASTYFGVSWAKPGVAGVAGLCIRNSKPIVKWLLLHFEVANLVFLFT